MRRRVVAQHGWHIMATLQIYVGFVDHDDDDIVHVGSKLSESACREMLIDYLARYLLKYVPDEYVGNDMDSMRQIAAEIGDDESAFIIRRLTIGCDPLDSFIDADV